MHKQNLFKFQRFVHKIVSGDEILTITKGHSSVVNVQKLMRNNLNLDMVKANAYAKFDQMPSNRSQDILRKRNFDNNQGPHLLVNLRKLTRNNPNLGLVKVNAANFDQIPAFRSQNIAGNEILTITNGHYRVVNFRKLTRNNSNVDLVNVNVYEKFGRIP